MSKLLKSLSKRSSSTPEQHENTVTGEFEVAVADEPSSLEIMIKEMNARLDTQSMLIEELSAKIREQEKDQDGEEYMVPVERLEEKIRNMEVELNSLIEEKASLLQGLSSVENRGHEEPVPPEPRVQVNREMRRYAVVATLGPNSADARGKSVEYLRSALPTWIGGYVKRHNVQVVSGPWLDDGSDLDQPHLNMTVVSDHDPIIDFSGWSRRKGYVYTSPVWYEAGWEAYSSRNHIVCDELRSGSVTPDEARKRILSKPITNAPKPKPIRTSVYRQNVNDNVGIAPRTFKGKGIPITFDD